MWEVKKSKEEDFSNIHNLTIRIHWSVKRRVRTSVDDEAAAASSFLIPLVAVPGKASPKMLSKAVSKSSSTADLRADTVAWKARRCGCCVWSNVVANRVAAADACGKATRVEKARAAMKEPRPPPRRITKLINICATMIDDDNENDFKNMSSKERW